MAQRLVTAEDIAANPELMKKGISVNQLHNFPDNENDPIDDKDDFETEDDFITSLEENELSEPAPEKAKAKLIVPKVALPKSTLQAPKQTPTKATKGKKKAVAAKKVVATKGGKKK